VGTNERVPGLPERYGDIQVTVGLGVEDV